MVCSHQALRGVTAGGWRQRHTDMIGGRMTAKGVGGRCEQSTRVRWQHARKRKRTPVPQTCGGGGGTLTMTTTSAVHKTHNNHPNWWNHKQARPSPLVGLAGPAGMDDPTRPRHSLDGRTSLRTLGDRRCGPTEYPGSGPACPQESPPATTKPKPPTVAAAAATAAKELSSSPPPPPPPSSSSSSSSSIPRPRRRQSRLRTHSSDGGGGSSSSNSSSNSRNSSNSNLPSKRTPLRTHPRNRPLCAHHAPQQTLTR